MRSAVRWREWCHFSPDHLNSPWTQKEDMVRMAAWGEPWWCRNPPHPQGCSIRLRNVDLACLAPSMSGPYVIRTWQWEVSNTIWWLQPSGLCLKLTGRLLITSTHPWYLHLPARLHLTPTPRQSVAMVLFHLLKPGICESAIVGLTNNFANIVVNFQTLGSTQLKSMRNKSWY